MKKIKNNSFNENVSINIRSEILRYLRYFYLSEEYNELIFNRCKEIWNRIKEPSILRSIKVLVPVTLYFTLILENIYISINNLIQIADDNKEGIKKCIYELLGTQNISQIFNYKNNLKEYHAINDQFSICSVCGAENDALFDLVFTTDLETMKLKSMILDLSDRLPHYSRKFPSITMGILCCKCYGNILNTK